MDTKTIARFWTKVDKAGPIPPHCPELGPCWGWTASKSHDGGYGKFRFNGRKVAAHRFAWEIERGPIPDGDGYHGTCVLHRCDNKSCVRPSHLVLGTQHDNIIDMAAKGRRRPTNGEANPRAKLTQRDVLAIRAARAEGTTIVRLARQFGVSHQLISRITNGGVW
jgi:hypothetical protein